MSSRTCGKNGQGILDGACRAFQLIGWRHMKIEIDGGRVLYGVIVGLALVVLIERCIDQGIVSAIVALWCEKGKC